jgi:hypothetical protein
MGATAIEPMTSTVPTKPAISIRVQRRKLSGRIILQEIDGEQKSGKIHRAG